MQIIADQQIACVREYFSGLGQVYLVDGREINADSIRDADILLIRSVTRVNHDLLQNSKVKFVGSATSGTDHIDFPCLKDSDIKFVHAPGSNARSVAEYVLSCLFIWAYRYGQDLFAKQVGIIGHGHVGSQLRILLESIGIRCKINDPPLKDRTGAGFYLDQEEVLSADIVTMHVPYTDTGKYPTRDMVNHNFLARMNKDALLINTARGNIIAEENLLACLERNEKMACILDVWQHEPQINTELLKKAFIATPHIAGYSFDGKITATEMLYQKASDYFLPDNQKKTIIPTMGEVDIVYIPSNGMDDQEIIKQVLLQHYNPDDDAMALQRILNISEKNEQGIYFDSLRKNYPVRREYPVTRISIPAKYARVAEKLRFLGFRVKQFEP